MKSWKKHNHPPLSLKIKELRSSRQLNKAQFAEQVGAAPAMVARWEENQAEPSVSTLYSIAAACGIDIHWFFSTTPDRLKTNVVAVPVFVADGRQEGFFTFAVSGDDNFDIAVRAEEGNAMPERGVLPNSIVLARFMGKAPQGKLCVVKTSQQYLIRSVYRYKHAGYSVVDQQHNVEEIKAVLVGKGKSYEIYPVVKIITDCTQEIPQVPENRMNLNLV